MDRGRQSRAGGDRRTRGRILGRCASRRCSRVKRVLHKDVPAVLWGVEGCPSGLTENWTASVAIAAMPVLTSGINLRAARRSRAGHRIAGYGAVLAQLPDI